ncbi:transglycosylase domain-containing protein [Sphingomonas xinjiangensis]|uniref:Penicillin-binding protein 1A n=1 Tax=Sphingomonas xinjiangensis TaxID=643568 RepID=A0A840YK05_9SPHN|nr:transglycosylase domain-containing protein [Sphingomonas xinjiangensis]MBB5711398.1 penicillin-binding protein 1A [Sphingomonas xinjiangensis]
MARDSGSDDMRFPLRRRAAEADIGEARPWRPVSAPRPEPLDLGGASPSYRQADDPYRPGPPPPPPPPLPPFPDGSAAEPEAYSTNLPAPPRPRRNVLRWISRGIAALILLFFVAVGWLAVTAPLNKSLQPPVPPSITLLASDGTPIARRGGVIGDPVDVTKLPEHVRDAFVAIEDRRFYSHWGVDPRGILRAAWHNTTSSGRSQGASTITQQLAKNAFLTLDRTATRKFQEVLIAFWLEAWLTKDEILSRYLSNVYFGDNAYGLRAASQHYFSVEPERMTVSQATMLAGLVKAPSRLAPTDNLAGARERQKLVVGAMVDAGLLTQAEGRRVRPAVLRVSKSKELPNGTYFADWVLPQARDRAGGVATEQEVRTTLDAKLQQTAERVVKSAGLRGTQVAMVAMKPDGRVVAMVGGRNYGQSPFNRATQARRQPGSTFKLFVYLAALRSGMTPDTMVDDTPVTIGDWKPANSDGRYAGPITLRQAFAKSSNVVAARLTNELGVRAVTRAARDLGISTPIGNDASIGLGTSGVSLLELTAAYAAIANGSYPVRPSGLDQVEEADDWLAKRLGGASRIPGGELEDLRSLLATVVEGGTGRSAALPIPAFGKTGTTQDARDALFVGWAGDLVVGVWIGNDDNSPIPGASGGGLPARIWRDFMVRAMDLKLPPPPPVEVEGDNAVSLDDVLNGVGDMIEGAGIDTEVIDPRAAPFEGEEEAGPPLRRGNSRRGRDEEASEGEPPEDDPGF